MRKSEISVPNRPTGMREISAGAPAATGTAYLTMRRLGFPVGKWFRVAAAGAAEKRGEEVGNFGSESFDGDA